ncbi:MAG: hypothetical protein NZT92_15965 [Abditibacteriales bacterium]|nr:hypothetical protein [Abditibacteriales bacterium]MDW8367430.1 hypothetical protein [Abditibacteriales bacterium]
MGRGSKRRFAFRVLSLAQQVASLGFRAKRNSEPETCSKMKKYFNTAGPCRADWHYMLPPERRAVGIPRLIETGQYFVLHAPRQTGKTTLIFSLCERLNAEGKYVALYVNVENAQVAGSDVLCRRCFS